MKILLDESLPVKLAEFFGIEHEVFTVRDMNWLGKRNGELLKMILKSSSLLIAIFHINKI